MEQQDQLGDLNDKDVEFEGVWRDESTQNVQIEDLTGFKVAKEIPNFWRFESASLYQPVFRMFTTKKLLVSPQTMREWWKVPKTQTLFLPTKIGL